MQTIFAEHNAKSKCRAEVNAKVQKERTILFFLNDKFL